MPVGHIVQLLEDGQVVDELEHREPRVQAEVLGEIAEPAADLDPVSGAGGPPAVDSTSPALGASRVARIRIRVGLRFGVPAVR